MVLKVGHVEEDYFFSLVKATRTTAACKPGGFSDPCFLFSETVREKERNEHRAAFRKKHNLEPNMHYFLFVGI